MLTSPEIAQLSAALVAAQKVMPNVSLDKQVSYKGINFQYASLSNCIAMTKPVLAAHGLAVVQYPKVSDKTLSVSTRLLHESGEWMESELSMSIESNDPKALGSILTYQRRYSYTAMLGIAHESDHDALAVEILYEGTEEHKQWLKSVLEPLGVGKDGMRSVHDYMIKHHYEMTQDAAITAMEKLR
jgi:hypothetical protein